MPTIEQKNKDQKQLKIKDILQALLILVPLITFILIIQLYRECEIRKINSEIGKCNFQNMFSMENFETFWPKILLAVVAACLFEYVRKKIKK